MGNLRIIKLFVLSAVLLIATLLARANAEEKSSTTNPNTNVVIKISVLASGKVLANGVETSLADMDKQLDQIKTQNGVVWYYRENGKGEPPSIAMDVIKLVIARRLPISMSSKPDFSDTIDQNGISHPRK
jgi:hypothetical protein